MTQPSDQLDEAALRLAHLVYRDHKRRRSAGAHAGGQPDVKRARVELTSAVDDKQQIEEKFDGVGLGQFQRAAAAALKEQYTELGYRSHGGNQRGIWVKSIVQRTKRSFSGERDTQILRHIAVAFFRMVRRRINAAEQEVQALLVNDRILIGSNYAKSLDVDPDDLADDLLVVDGLVDRSKKAVRKLTGAVSGDRIASRRSELVKAMVERAEQALDDNEGDEDAAEKALADDEDFQDWADDLESWERAQEIAEIIGAALDDGSLVETLDIDAAAAAIEDDEYRGMVILVHGIKDIHAELNLVVAYAQSGSTAPAKVFGKKRPCMACFVTLMYAHEKLGLDIEFNRHPGGLYQGNLVRVIRTISARLSTDDFEQVHEEALALLEEEDLDDDEKGKEKVRSVVGEFTQFLPKKQYKTSGEDDHDTDSGTEYSSDEESDHEQLTRFDALAEESESDDESDKGSRSDEDSEQSESEDDRMSTDSDADDEEEEH